MATPSDQGARSVKIEASISEAWDTLADLVDEGRLSDAQFRHLTRLDNDIPKGPPLVRAWWAATLRRAILHPANVGVSIAKYACPECLDVGSIERPTGEHPCRRCNPGPHALWRDHWRLGYKHTCADCSPRRRARQDAEAARTERNEATRASLT